MKLGLITAALVGVCASLAHAHPVDPFVRDDTLVIAKLDLTAIDQAMLEKEVRRYVEAAVKANAELGELRDPGGQVIDALREAPIKAMRDAGAKDVFVLIGTTSFMRGGPTVVCPVPDQATADKLMIAIPDDASMKESYRDGAVVVAPTEAMNAPASKRAEVTDALSMLDAVPAGAAFVPMPQAIRLFTSAVPMLPPELGGGSTVELSKGFRIAIVEASLDEHVALKARVVAVDAAAATKLVEQLRAIHASALKSVPAEGKPMIESLIVSIDERQPTEVHVAPRDAQANEQFKTEMASGFVMARITALRVQTMTYMRQIGTALRVYASDHKNALPDSLDVLMQNKWPAELFVSATTGKPFVYVGNSKMLADDLGAEFVLVHESIEGLDDARMISVLFGDGHVETLRVSQLKQQLQRQAGAKKD